MSEHANKHIQCAIQRFRFEKLVDFATQAGIAQDELGFMRPLMSHESWLKSVDLRSSGAWNTRQITSASFVYENLTFVQIET